jgi:ATP/maltotriose-dependent transcriptional regulator MalT
MNYAVCALQGPTFVKDALERCLGLVELVREDRRAESVVLGVVAVLHAMRGDRTDALEASARSRANLVDLGMSLSSISTVIETSRVLMLIGDPAGAELELRQAHDAVEQMGESYLRSTLACYLAKALWVLGRRDEADHFASVAEEFADADDVDSQVIWRTIRARVLADAGQADSAVELAQGAVARAAGTDDIDLQGDALRALAEVHAAIGNEEAREPALRQALDLYERKGDEAQAASIRSWRVEGQPA